jgi:3-mercaptopyruvate sulfurtransferase SseA
MLMNQTFNHMRNFMNTMMIRLLSAVSFAVVAILGADLSAAEVAKTGTETADKPADHAKKPEAKHAKKKEEAKPVAPVAEKTIDEVEAALGKAIIVDARGSGDEAIKGAIFLGAQAEDKEIHEKLKDKTAEIIVYCGSVSCPASNTLAYRLIELGYTNVAHYAGGIKEWTENSKPVDTKEKAKA